jgi:predicted ATPase
MRLGATASELLDVAAVAGMEVDAQLLASMRPDASTEELVSVGLLEPTEGLLRFRHPLLQEATYEEVPPQRKRALHREIAGVLAARDHEPVERVAAHLERAERAEAALSTLDAAASVASAT